MRAYNQSAATLNLLRGFSTGGYASLDRVLKWNLDFMGNSDEAHVSRLPVEQQMLLLPWTLAGSVTSHTGSCTGAVVFSETHRTE